MNSWDKPEPEIAFFTGVFSPVAPTQGILRPWLTDCQADSRLSGKLFCVDARMTESSDDDDYVDAVGTDERLRRKVQELIDQGVDQRTLANAMEISESTLSRWLERAAMPLRVTSLDGLLNYLRKSRQAFAVGSNKSVSEVGLRSYDYLSRPSESSPAAESHPAGDHLNAPLARPLPSREALAASAADLDDSEIIRTITATATQLFALATELELRNTGQQAPAPHDSQPEVGHHRRTTGRSAAKKRRA